MSPSTSVFPWFVGNNTTIFNNYNKYLLLKANSTYIFIPMKDMGPPYF